MHQAEPVYTVVSNMITRPKQISHFRRNGVNHCSWLPEKLHYESFGHMLGALQIVASYGAKPGMGKADFKSAFKTWFKSSNIGDKYNGLRSLLAFSVLFRWTYWPTPFYRRGSTSRVTRRVTCRVTVYVHQNVFIFEWC